MIIISYQHNNPSQSRNSFLPFICCRPSVPGPDPAAVWERGGGSQGSPRGGDAEDEAGSATGQGLHSHPAAAPPGGPCLGVTRAATTLDTHF